MMILSGLVTTIRRLGAWTTQKIRPRLAAALAALAAAAAAAALFAGPASAAVTGRTAQTEATRASVPADWGPAGTFLTLAGCQFAGWVGVHNGEWSDYECLPENFLRVPYWQLMADYEYG